MFYIDFKDDKFNVSIKTDKYMDRDDYMEMVNYLKSKEIHFDTVKNNFKLPEKQVDALIQWFIRNEREYSLSIEAINQIELLQAEWYTKDLQIYRGRSYDETFFREHILQSDINLYDFQKEDISWRLKRNGYLDGNDAGLGKTLTTICVFSYLYFNKHIDSIFILVPIGLSYHWKYEILQSVKLFTEDDIHIINNKNKIKPFEDVQDKKIIIVPNYLLPDVVLSYKKSRVKKKTRSKKGERWHTEKFFDLKKLWNKESIFLGVDESHELKNIKAIRTKVVHAIRDNFSYRIELSATPNINRFEDLYSQISIIDRSIIPMTHDAFQLWLAESINLERGFNIETYHESRVKQVLDSIKPVFTKRLKEDVPEMKYKRIVEECYLELNSRQKQIYQLLATEELKHLHEEYDIITWRLFFNKFPILMEVFENPLLLKNRHYSLDVLNKLLDKYDIDEDPKFIFLKTKLESIIDNQDDKVVVYDYRPDTLNMLYEKFKHYNPLMIHGGIKVKDKEKDRKEKEYLFNTDKKYRLMLLSEHTSSQGINLNRMCNTTIYYNVVNDTVKVRQGFDRTVRINNTRDGYVLIPYYAETLERIKIQTALQRIDLNDRMGKELTQEDLARLLRGRI